MRRKDRRLEFHALDRHQKLTRLDFGPLLDHDVDDDTRHGCTQELCKVAWGSVTLGSLERVDRIDTVNAAAKVDEVDISTDGRIDGFDLAVEVEDEFSGVLGRPDAGANVGIVVNMTKELVWVREGILPDYPNSRAPQFDFTNGQLIVPHPTTSREEIQEPFVREQQIDPKKYYPPGYMPHLLENWPVDGDIVIPIDLMPEKLKASMGAAWRQKLKNQKILEERGEQ